MTPETRKRFEADLVAAEPYTDEEMGELDGKPRDYARVKATFARKFLREADKQETEKQRRKQK